MAMPVYIQDPSTGTRLAVSSDGLLVVSTVAAASADLPPAVLTKQKQLRSFLAQSGGGVDLNIDASTAETEFTIAAENDRTKWITAVRVLFNGDNMEMDSNDFRRFGSATANQTPLTNGVKLFVVQSGLQTDFFINAVTRMGEFFDYSDDFQNITNAIDSQSDFLYFDFDFDVPVVLPPGTTDKISITINDDLTDLDLFRVIARGYQELT